MEKANAQMFQDASILRGASHKEGADLKGFYRVEVLRPFEEARKEYIKLRSRLETLLSNFSRNAEKEIRVIVEEMERMIGSREVDAFENLVTTVGKNLALDTLLGGAAYTVTGPYIGLISSISWSAVAAADTMAAHAGWTEAGTTNAPTYTIPRKTAAWSAATGGSKSLSANSSFAITGAGTVKGCFMVLGSGALNTIMNTAGTLYSAGTFSGGDKVVGNGDTLNVSYTASM
jgi:hypothetical protein